MRFKVTGTPDRGFRGDFGNEVEDVDAEAVRGGLPDGLDFMSNYVLVSAG